MICQILPFTNGYSSVVATLDFCGARLTYLAV